MRTQRLSPRGLAAGATAFTIWGLFPLYLYPLREVPAPQIIAHRIAWSCLFILTWMLVRGELGRLTGIFTRPALLARLALSAFLITSNWLVYVWGATHGHIVDTSLGYYINPLVNVLLGVLVLHERLNARQWLAVSLAAVAVSYLTWLAGHPPWIACTLALSFSLYGLVRKVISVDALPGLATETLLLVPFALAYLVACQYAGRGAFGHSSATVNLLLIGSGLVTAVPLFLFAYGARALPYSTIGVLQYIGPTLQLLCGVLVLHEGFTPARALGFTLIWAALLIYAADGLWTARSARLARA
ncbi:MAG TPA: EamA family transporter RarD [Steroidobacteraceae bacterium]|jgi:chloramphenicol-sensitive protein RarD|nr:EamA family transporter RarD [Steroidobacteraceae bacterium]